LIWNADLRRRSQKINEKRKEEKYVDESTEMAKRGQQKK
jgi:hypothetical protein